VVNLRSKVKIPLTRGSDISEVRLESDQNG
jgi:hypothetical protein